MAPKQVERAVRELLEQHVRGFERDAVEAFVDYVGARAPIAVTVTELRRLVGDFFADFRRYQRAELERSRRDP